jgi:hypothetical protein
MKDKYLSQETMVPVEQQMLQLANVSHSQWQNLHPGIDGSDPCH